MQGDGKWEMGNGQAKHLVLVVEYEYLTSTDKQDDHVGRIL